VRAAEAKQRKCSVIEEARKIAATPMPYKMSRRERTVRRCRWRKGRPPGAVRHAALQRPVHEQTTRWCTLLRSYYFHRFSFHDIPCILPFRLLIIPLSVFRCFCLIAHRTPDRPMPKASVDAFDIISSICVCCSYFIVQVLLPA